LAHYPDVYLATYGNFGNITHPPHISIHHLTLLHCLKARSN